MPMIDDGLKADVIKWSAFYEHRIKMGSVSIAFFSLTLTCSSWQKHVFHLEAFVAKFMRIMEGYV